jgi:hypothetical protein
LIYVIAELAGISCPPRCLSKYEDTDPDDTHSWSFESLVKGGAKPDHCGGVKVGQWRVVGV